MKIETDLIFNDGIPEVFGEFTHRVSVCIVFLVAEVARALGYGL